MRPVARSRRAFTLIETLLALALVALLSGSVFGFLFSLAERRRDLDRVVHREEGASVLCEQIEAGLLCALAGDATIGAGVKGDGGSIRIVSRGVRLPTSKAGPKGATDLVASEFRFDAGSGQVRAKRWEAGQSEPDAEVLIEHVRLLRIRYHDGGEWVESFDSVARNQLPGAVEISIWFGEQATAPKEGEPAGKAVDAQAIPPPPDRVRLVALADSGGPQTSEVAP